MVEICNWSVCNIRLVCIFFFFYGLDDIMDNGHYDKNEICSESTNFCGFSTFTFAFILFVVPGR